MESQLRVIDDETKEVFDVETPDGAARFAQSVARRVICRVGPFLGVMPDIARMAFSRAFLGCLIGGITAVVGTERTDELLDQMKAALKDVESVPRSRLH